VAIGVVHRLIEGDLLSGAMAFAREFTKYSLPVLGLARQTVHRALSAPQDEGPRVEAELATLAYQTADTEEGPAAFLEKRPPNFHDR